MTETMFFTVGAGRDADKVFTVSTMPAQRAEEWVLQAFLLAARAGITTLPDDLTGAGVAGLLGLDWTGLRNAHWNDLQPLLAEVKRCIGYAPDPTRPDDWHSLGTADVEDVGTLIALRMEWIKLHLPLIASLRPAPLVPGVVTPPVPIKKHALAATQTASTA